MALLQIFYHSDVLELNTQINVVFPDSLLFKHSNISQARVVYMLHGTGGDCSEWLRFTSIERYAQERDFILIFPSCARSAYSDQKSGFPYWTYLTEELPQFCQSMFHLPTSRARTFVAGLSMGGYGALKWGLTKPNQFKAIAALSSGIDRISICTLNGEKTISQASEQELMHYRTNQKFPWGERVCYEFEHNWKDIPTYNKEGNNLFLLSSNLTIEQKKELPNIYIAVGTEDPNYADHCKLRKHFDHEQISYVYNEEAGSHTWSFFDKYIEKAFNYFYSL